MNTKVIGLLICSAVLLSVFAHAAAQEPRATVKISGKSLAAGVGFTWGSGVLIYHGRQYPFNINGVSAGAFGIAAAEVTGEVLNLNSLADFDGNYTSVGAGITVGGGANGATMKNQNGVIMHVVATTQGLELKLGIDGLNIALWK